MNIVERIENAPLHFFSEENCDNLYLKYIRANFTDFEKKLFLSFGIGGLNKETGCFIDLDDFWHWIGFPQKAKAKRSIIKHLVLNESYEIRENTENRGGRGGQNKEKIFLSVDGFKMLCLLQRSPRADEITSYFSKMMKVAFKMMNGEFDEKRPAAEATA